jgi:hypothetical protein
MAVAVAGIALSPIAVDPSGNFAYGAEGSIYVVSINTGTGAPTAIGASIVVLK